MLLLDEFGAHPVREVAVVDDRPRNGAAQPTADAELTGGDGGDQCARDFRCDRLHLCPIDFCRHRPHGRRGSRRCARSVAARTFAQSTRRIAFATCSASCSSVAALRHRRRARGRRPCRLRTRPSVVASELRRPCLDQRWLGELLRRRHRLAQQLACHAPTLLLTHGRHPRGTRRVARRQLGSRPHRRRVVAAARLVRVGGARAADRTPTARACRATRRSPSASASSSSGAVPAPGGLGMLLAAPTIAVHGTPEQIEQLRAADRHRPAGVVPAVQRARRGQRPRRPRLQGGEGRRRVDGQRPEGVDQRRPDRRHGHADRPHRSRRAQAPGHHLVRVRHAPAGRSRSGRCAR